MAETKKETKEVVSIDEIMSKLSLEDQTSMKKLLYGSNYEPLELPETVMNFAKKMQFEIGSYRIISTPEQVRKARVVRMAALQTKLPLPTTAPVIEMRAAIWKRAEEAIELAAKAKVNIFCLQELWTMPYFFCTREKQPWCEFAEPAENGPTTKFLQVLARKNNMVIVSPILERDEVHSDVIWNTAVVIDNHGDVLGKHRKNHIPRNEDFNESTYYFEGNTGHEVFETEFGKIAINICYGRHHVLNWLMYGLNGAELVFNPSVEAGDFSEVIWPIEPRCAAAANSYFTCAINRVGTEVYPNEFTSGDGKPAHKDFGHCYGSTYITAPDGTRTPALSRVNEILLKIHFYYATAY
ncbi:beta-ureidopropionase-like [Agrilus planipennis]|uniref:Beta-ureidopropionase-like n=1 Tax=Agrilus planipennis TaxID=224129 RepID=A0A7F5RE18_AGRPL|nr:beta-ureidopropionase-like [Agrilus planipennis]